MPSRHVAPEMGPARPQMSMPKEICAQKFVLTDEVLLARSELVGYVHPPTQLIFVIRCRLGAPEQFHRGRS
jgi:hypothetical protein